MDLPYYYLNNKSTGFNSMDINREILQRYFRGKYSRNDYKQITNMFREPEKNNLKKDMNAEWDSFSEGNLSEVDLSETSKRIHQRIRFEDGIRTRNNFFHTFQRIAAILIVPLILAFGAYYFFNAKINDSNIAYAEIECPLGVRTKFQLPDGTNGYLNSGSKLKYPVSFSEDRHVELKGEAYFDVVHDANQLFTVETRHLKIAVLGTQFNVLAYGNASTEEVVLQRGKVDISTIEGEHLDMLKPNEELILSKEARKFSVNKVEAFQYTSWIEGKLILRNEKFADVARRIGRWYNAEIKIEDKELMEYAFRATFTDESLEEVLKLLKLTAPFNFEEPKRNVTIDNEYEKRTIVISLDRKRLSAFR